MTYLGDIAPTDNVLYINAGQSNAAVANTNLAMALAKFGNIWASIHRVWVKASGAWQNYQPGVNSNTWGTGTGQNWSWGAPFMAARAALGHTGLTDNISECVSGNGVDPKYNQGQWYIGGLHPEGLTYKQGARVKGLKAQIIAALAAGVIYDCIKIAWTHGEKDLDADGSAINYRALFTALVLHIRAIPQLAGIPIDFLIVRIRPTNATAETARHLRGSNLRNGAYRAMTEDLAGVPLLTVGMINVDDCGIGYPANDWKVHPAQGDPNWMYQACDRITAYYAGTYRATYGSIAANDPGPLADLATTTAPAGTPVISGPVDMAELIEQRAGMVLPTGVEAQLTAFNGDVVVDWSPALNWTDKYLKARFRATATGDETHTLHIGGRAFGWRVVGI